jgi:hypothetical protein
MTHADILDRMTYTGPEDILNVYECVREDIVDFLAHESTWDWDGYIKSQAIPCRDILEHLRDVSRYITPLTLANMMSEEIALLLNSNTNSNSNSNTNTNSNSNTNSNTKSKSKVKITILVPTPSSIVAFLLYVHVTIKKIGLTKLSDVLEDVTLERSASNLFNNNKNKYYLLEDAIYSGRTLAALLESTTRRVGSTKHKLTLVAPLATREALKILAPFCKIRADQCILPYIFDGLTVRQVLLMDVYYYVGSNLLSYIFDVLKLDERNTLVLLRHKVNDPSMAPHILLHMGPAFDATEYFQFSETQVDRFLSTISTERKKDNPHARISYRVKTERPEMTSYTILKKILKKHVYILEDGDRDLAYARRLSLFS